MLERNNQGPVAVAVTFPLDKLKKEWISVKAVTLTDIIKSVRRIEKLIQLQKNPVSGKLPQVCTYCGWGVYKEVASGSGAHVQNFGFRVTGNPDWRVLACDECGHIDLFRVDLAKDNNWWKIDKRP